MESYLIPIADLPADLTLLIRNATLGLENARTTHGIPVQMPEFIDVELTTLFSANATANTSTKLTPLQTRTQTVPAHSVVDTSVSPESTSVTTRSAVSNLRTQTAAAHSIVDTQNVPAHNIVDTQVTPETTTTNTRAAVTNTRTVTPGDVTSEQSQSGEDVSTTYREWTDTTTLSP